MKVEPSPGLLSTVISPPIMRQKCRLMARPRPVPPYLRVVEASACENSWNSRPICSCVMPIPVSVTPMVIQSRPSSRCACAVMVTVPFSVNLLALLARLSSACRKRVWSAWAVPRSVWQSTTMRLPFFVAIGSMVLATSSISGASANDFEMKLHAPCLDLRQVEDVIDQCEQVATRAKNAIERLDVLLQCLRILPQHLGDADDGIERGSQLMAHVGEELRFVLARFGKLPALLLDLVEQSCILDRQDRLRAEGLQEIDRALGKFARLLAAHHQRADDPIGAEQWNGQQRAEAGADDHVENR